MNFDMAFERLIGNEGGLVDNPSDPGGLTNWGISQRSYPHLDIRSITQDAAKEIYRRDFWNRGSMDQYFPSIAFQAFDAAVNHGIESAVRMLQRAAGAADDGHVGPITINAIKSKTETDMLMLFIAERIEFWTRLSSWPTFGKGWARRAAADLRFAAEDS